MQDKTIVLTGITDGLGKQFMELMATQRNTYILIGRNKSKLLEIETMIKEKNKASLVDSYISDLSLLKEVARVAQQIKEKYPVIDYAIYNAGAVAKQKGQKTKEGLSFSLALNYLAPLLINETLKSSLQAAASPVIYYTTTQMMPEDFKLTDLDEFDRKPIMDSYAISKLLFCLYLEDIADQSTFDIKIFDPTTMYTNTLTNVFPEKLHWLSPVARLFSKSPKKVAQSVLKVLNKQDQAGATHYYTLDKPSKVKTVVKNKELQKATVEFGKKRISQVD